MPGQYGQTAPAPYGVQVSGQPGAAFPDQYYPYNENLFEIRQIKDTLRFDYEKDNAREKDEIFYLLMAKIEEIEAEIEKDNRVTPGIINQLQIELEKAGRKDLSLRLGKLDEKLKVAIRIDLVGNMKVKDAILNAGGLTANASMESGEIIRQYPNNEFRTTYFNVARAMEGIREIIFCCRIKTGSSFIRSWKRIQGKNFLSRAMSPNRERISLRKT